MPWPLAGGGLDVGLGPMGRELAVWGYAVLEQLVKAQVRNEQTGSVWGGQGRVDMGALLTLRVGAPALVLYELAELLFIEVEARKAAAGVAGGVEELSNGGDVAVAAAGKGPAAVLPLPGPELYY